jgi:hypothetical protein
MTARLTFVGIAIFWLTMNVLLWRAEFGSQGGDTDIPVGLVWRKILTAPDPSSLSVYQNAERMGYCEFSTSVGQQMATVDADKPPPEGLARQAGYQIHLAGNVSFGDFTNRIKFDGSIQFVNPRQWREFTFRITSRLSILELHSVFTNQTLNVKITTEGIVLERELPFEDLRNPAAVLRAFLGDFADNMLSNFDLPALAAIPAGQAVEWSAIRTRLKIGTEALPVYQLKTVMLGREVSVVVSTLGEVLRVSLPGNIVARIDQ